MKKITRKCIVMLTAFAMLISALGNLSFSAAADSLIQNGDFENGTTGFVIEKGGYTGAKVETVTASDGGKMLSIETGSIGGSLHTFRVYQAVEVEPNTDYVWKLELGGSVQNCHYLGIVAGDTVKANGNTALFAEWQTVSGSITFTPNNFNTGAQSNSDGTAADSNWLRFDAATGWNHVKITFNSGNNTKVCLAYGARHTGRAIKTDNWSLYKRPAVGKLTNGDFNDGMIGFTGTAQTMEVIAEPGNAANNVLHAIGGGYVRQEVSVKANTDYVFTFRTKKADTQGVIYANVFAADAKTNLAAAAKNMEVPNNVNFAGIHETNGVQFNSSGTAWNNIEIFFNSGENTTVYINFNLWTTNRNRYFDDLQLYEKPEIGNLANGDFNNGTAGFTNINTATFEVIKEPDNTDNNVLHLIGGGSYYQQVSVVKNTDYIWTFRMKDIGNTGTTRILVNPENGTDNLITDIAKNGNGYASLNDGTYASAATYNKAWVTFTVKFNSGDNENVRLSHNTWAASREIYMDDWNLDRAALPGELRNGGFEDGLKYFAVDGNTSAEVTKEDVYDGAYSAKVNGKDNSSKPAFGRFIYQEVTVKPNTDYIWSFWYKSKAHNTSLVGVRSADDKLLLPSFLKTDAYAVESDRSFTDIRNASDINLWHETLYDTDWKQYNVIFNSGENTSVRLSIDLINSARGGFTDNWALGEYTFMRGDADNDGTVDANDLAEIRRRLFGVPSYYMGGIDVNEDGQFNILDLVKLKKDLVSLTPIAGYSLVWADDFGGLSLDNDKWTRAQHMAGQDDLELRYDETGATVKDGSAVLYAGRTGENTYYTNASLTTSNSSGSAHRMSFKYGYVEMRAKIPLGAPAFPSFWMKSLNNNGVHGEIDIFEHFCYIGDKWIQSGIHKWYENGEHLLLTGVGDKAAIGGTNLSDGGWHTYGLLWTPEKLEFICDGVTYHTIDITADGNYEVYNTSTKELTGNRTENGDVFHDYYYLIMNNYIYTPAGTNGADYAANPSTELPLEYEIDYIRLYQNSDGDIRIGALG